ncbi:hypothetical protein [Streptomyces silvensis]|uniref:Uncharacterized protein n=1 Tax=Streptomyces silvensis TaxID=1765722 RepID=A0A0W7X7Q9_9ACTN|nr:hypothetical protein [Streptomyces silvensis]KUF18895.1 hypothetical protein AT728_07655 [Streptomyces silvensis]
MTERKSFQTHLRQAATGILERVPEQLKREIYVLALNIWRIDADNRRPYVDIGYNTESQYEEQMRRDSDHREARWNYAFWILEGFDRLGNVPEDRTGGPLYEEEVRNLGIWYDGEFDLGRTLEDDGLRAKSGLLELHFHDAVVGLARHLHESGTIERIFGRPLPVVVFDMDCPGWEEEATKAANPVELIEDFLA